ncbi:MAG: DUF5916 domain-containing protein [Cyclobacteriaceae bacterium]
MRNLYLVLSVVILLFGAFQVAAQNKPGTEFHIKKANSPIVLDGLLDEEAWQAAEVAGGFWMSSPIDSMAPINPSEVKLTFDSDNLYVAFICYDDNTEMIIQSMKRDFDFRTNDNIGIYFDPYDDRTNGFYFNVNPLGVQREGLMAGGGNAVEDFSSFWDNKWYTAYHQYDDRYVVEIAVPFKSIRYNAGDWNFQVVRNDAKRNQVSSLIAVPLQYIPANFASAGKLIWDDPPPKPGLNVSLIPYVAGSAIKDNEAGIATEYSPAVGFDAKIAVTPSLNLDLTVNPDFSQVEVDQQVINLTQFEFGFPERRQFFLENNDLFEQPGFPESRPFFSRRIGLARDTVDELQKVPIAFGARLSGKIGTKWRVGLMNMQTSKEESLGLPSQNYSVGVIQRNLGMSNIGFVIVNKESLGVGEYDSTKFYHDSLIKEEMVNNQTVRTLNTYNRVLGVDYNLRSINNKWRGDIYYHHSFDAQTSDKNYSFGSFIGYFARNVNVLLGQSGAGENFNAEVGFVPKLSVFSGYHSGFSRIETRLFPKNGGIANMGPFAQFSFNNVPGDGNTDKEVIGGYAINFFSTATLQFSYTHTFQRLVKDFNPIDEDLYDGYLAGEQFSWNRVNFIYNSDQRSVFTYQLGGNFGTFYNGDNTNFNGQVSYRFQPYGSLAVRFDYNDISLPENYGDEKLTLIGPRLDLTFTDKMFLTTFVQYNNVADNVNLNSRFQWRFKPASDFFVVYTENYLANNFQNKNRALVLKFTYWFNL